MLEFGNLLVVDCRPNAFPSRCWVASRNSKPSCPLPRFHLSCKPTYNCPYHLLPDQLRATPPPPPPFTLDCQSQTSSDHVLVAPLHTSTSSHSVFPHLAPNAYHPTYQELKMLNILYVMDCSFWTTIKLITGNSNCRRKSFLKTSWLPRRPLCNYMHDFWAHCCANYIKNKVSKAEDNYATTNGNHYHCLESGFQILDILELSGNLDVPKTVHD